MGRNIDNSSAGRTRDIGRTAKIVNHVIPKSGGPEHRLEQWGIASTSHHLEKREMFYQEQTKSETASKHLVGIHISIDEPF